MLAVLIQQGVGVAVAMVNLAAALMRMLVYLLGSGGWKGLATGLVGGCIGEYGGSPFPGCVAMC